MTASAVMTAADQSKARRRTGMSAAQRGGLARKPGDVQESPDAIASFGATHEPPTASTFGQAR